MNEIRNEILSFLYDCLNPVRLLLNYYYHYFLKHLNIFLLSFIIITEISLEHSIG